MDYSFVPLELQKAYETVLLEKGQLDLQIAELAKKETELSLKRQKLEDEMRLRIEEHNREEAEALANKSSSDTEEDSSGDEYSVSSSEPRYELLEDKDARRQDKVALASYPRSGNSLLRRHLENMTNIITGSDSDPERFLIKALTRMGFQGEGIVDSSVWITKTHFPERMGYAKLLCRRAILLVRNPFDCIASYFNMVLTQTHTESVLDSEVFGKYQPLWQDFVREEIMVWKSFYAHWLATDLPKLVLRFEDLLQNRAQTLKRIKAFLYSGLDFGPKKSVLEMCREPAHSYGVYRARAVPIQKVEVQESEESLLEKHEIPPLDAEFDRCGAENLTKGAHGYLNSLGYFSENQRKDVCQILRDELAFFGYTKSFPKTWNLLNWEQPKPGRCIVRNQHTQGLHKCNARVPLRPQTKDDPHARGFGKRWKTQVAMLPKPRLKQKS